MDVIACDRSPGDDGNAASRSSRDALVRRLCTHQPPTCPPEAILATTETATTATKIVTLATATIATMARPRPPREETG